MICMQLVVAEKPSVGMALAKALGVSVKKDGYVEDENVIISWCVGHLVCLANADMYDEKYKKWNIADLPIIPESWQFIVAEDKNKQFGVLRQLMEDSRVCKEQREAIGVDTLFVTKFQKNAVFSVQTYNTRYRKFVLRH